MKTGLGYAKDKGYKAVFVLGDPNYYRRFGFDVDLASRFACKYAGPNFMVHWLNGEVEHTEGYVEYAHSFYTVLNRSTDSSKSS